MSFVQRFRTDLQHLASRGRHARAASTRIPDAGADRSRTERRQEASQKYSSPGVFDLSKVLCRGSPARTTSEEQVGPGNGPGRNKDLVEPPFNPADTAVARAVGDGGEESIGAVDGAVNTTHTLVADRGLDCGARGRIVQSQGTAAVWVVVGFGAHEFVRQCDLHVAVGVAGPAASTQTTIPVSDISNAGIALTLAIGTV